MSQRRAALLLRVDQKTVARKLRFLADRSREIERKRRIVPLSAVQFDDLETSVHTKCKPVSVALAVEPETRKILGFQVSQMPPKGLLAEISRRKYGMRRDHRKEGWDQLFSSLREIVKEDAVFLSDQNPFYPAALKKHFPDSTHNTVEGKRGCITGQGELKQIGNDPLFSLNHTCAMLRANLNRLFRRTWCTTKTLQGLIDHISIYVRFHNQWLTKDLPKSTD